MNTALRKCHWVCTLICILISIEREAYGQAGLRDSLELLDRDQDGMIDPDEITPLARPYLERIAQAQRLSLERPNRIDKFQTAARIYHALQNGVSGARIDPEEERSLRSFRPRDEDPIVPEFGLPVVKYRYTQDDLDEADDTLRRSDRNRDGKLDKREASRAKWTHRDPFNMDLNGDEHLSRLELAQRYARRRMLKDDSKELVQRSRRTGGDVRSSAQDRDDERKKSEWWRRGGSKYWLTASLLSRFDRNRNGRLESSEAAELGIPVGPIDADRDGELSRDEIYAHVSTLQDQAGDVTEGLPGWFYELDEDRDQQISLPEFGSEDMTDARVAEFVALDGNQDGLLTAAEILASKSMTGGTFENSEAEVLPPRKTIVSEININESFVVADLNVRINITHTHTSHLDAYLTGPDGQRIELFTGVGGHDDHFNGTVFDDQARTPITKARPPFEGSFLPEGLLKRQPGLSVFNGKSVEGIWQLTIRCSNSERFGMLHNWAIMARPDEEQLIGQSEETNSTATPSVTPQMVGAVAPAPEYRDQGNEYQGGGSSTPSSWSTPGEFWTPERKAEFVNKFRKPTKDEDWKSLSSDEKRKRLEERKAAIEKYKKMIQERSGKT